MATNTKTPSNSGGVIEGLGTDVVKQGFLWIKRPPRSYWNRLKAWHKRYFLLRDSFLDNTSILEMYNCQQDVKTSAIPLLSLVLNETVHIGIASESHRFPNVLVLVCNGRAPLLLAADDELAARSWLLALDLCAQSKFQWTHNCCKTNICSTQSNDHNHHHNSESDSSTNGSACSCAPAFVRESSGFSDPTHGLHSNNSSDERIPDDLLWTSDWHENNSVDVGLVMERFQVSVQSTEASERACLRGQLQLVIFTRGVGVARIGDFECFLLWPIAFIRQYRLESHKNKNNNSSHNGNDKNAINKSQNIVTLEVGRRCSTGEGMFSFRTSHGQDIMRQMKRAISNWANYRANCRSNASPNSQQTCPTMSRTHRSRYSRSGRSSAPCTPTCTPIMSKMLDCAITSAQSTSPSPRKLFQINCHKREDQSKVIQEKSCTSDDVNYVIPIFADNEVIEETTNAEYVYRKPYERCQPFDREVNVNSSGSSDDKCMEACDGVDGNAYIEVIAT